LIYDVYLIYKFFKNVISSYFSPDGIEFNVGRVPIAGCDYSPRTYSYDDYPAGVTLSNFSLQAEDFAYKVYKYSDICIL